MTTQKEEILKIIVAMKVLKWPVSKIEQQLGFSNGLIGKAAKGGTELSSDKMEKLQKFFKEKTNYTEPVKDEAKMIVEGKRLKVVPSDEKMDKVRTVMDQLNKDYGAGTVMIFGEKPNQEYEVISTGSLLLNEALGIGGLPRGRMVEIFGSESSGKTTLALNVIADAQKQGLKCLLIDAENSFDPEYASALGVNVDEMLYCQPSYGEQGFEVADKYISNGEVGVVVIDSVAAMIPKAELEGQMGDSKMGLHARLMSQACRKMVGSVAKTNTLLIFINQIRNKIGVMFTNPEVTTGGVALQFYASIRLEVKRSTSEQNSVINDGIKQGNLTTVKVIKNKCAPPFRSAQFYIMYGTGIDNVTELVELATDKGIITKQGSWYSYENQKIGQGAQQVKQFFQDNEELYREIYDKTINQVPVE